MKKLLSLFLIISVLLSLCSCAGEKNKDGITIIATSFPLYDFAREIVKDKGTVTLLLKPGQDAHSYDPTAKEIAAIKNCSLFLCIGGEDEKWVSTLLSGSSLKGVNSLSLIDFLHTSADHGEEGHVHDEHFWTSPKKSVIMVEKIRDELISLFPQYEKEFIANAEAYLSELYKLDSSLTLLSEEAKGKTVVFGDRFPFTHMFGDYGLSYMSVYPGCSEMTEPSASVMAEIIEAVKAQGIGTVFVTQFSNGKIADTICEKTGAKKQGKRNLSFPYEK